jgi:hypothetical protein
MSATTWAVISRWSGETVELFLVESDADSLRKGLGEDDFSVVECDYFGNPL